MRSRVPSTGPGRAVRPLPGRPRSEPLRGRGSRGEEVSGDRRGRRSAVRGPPSGLSLGPASWSGCSACMLSPHPSGGIGPNVVMWYGPADVSGILSRSLHPRSSVNWTNKTPVPGKSRPVRRLQPKSCRSAIAALPLHRRSRRQPPDAESGLVLAAGALTHFMGPADLFSPDHGRRGQAPLQADPSRHRRQAHVQVPRCRTWTDHREARPWEGLPAQSARPARYNGRDRKPAGR